MSYVPTFQHDVFLSYPHVENTSSGDEPGWVSQFALDLERQLDRLAGRAGLVSIWRDPRLQGHNPVEKTISAAVRGSAVIVAVLSPAYVDSTWCLEGELRTFVKEPHSLFGRVVGECSRVFKVGSLGLNEPRERMLKQDNDLRFIVEDLTGFNFFGLEPFSRSERPFRRTRPEDPDQRYHQKIDDLARGIIQTLEVMAAQVAAHPKVSLPVGGLIGISLPPIDGKVVYVAQATDDVSDYRDQLVRELEERGLRVVPRQPLPSEEPLLSQAIAGLLDQVQLAVHLFGQFYGQVPGGGQKSIAHTQYAAVFARAAVTNSSYSQIVWIPSGLQFSTLQPRQKEFLDAIESGEGGWTPEVLRTGIEQLKDAVLRKVAPSEAKSSGISGESRPLVYISCLPSDRQIAERLTSFLKGEHADVAVSPLIEDEKLRLKDFKTHVAASDGVLVLYESADPVWVRSRVLEARKIAKRRRRRSLRATAVYESPPPERTALGLNFERWHIINCRSGHSPQQLRDFVAELRK